MRSLRFVAVTLLVAFLLVGAVPLVSTPAQGQAAEPLAQFDVSSITPNIVTTDAAGDLTVTGTLTNTSDHPLSNVEAIVQRGSSPDSDSSAHEALQGNASGITAPMFKPLAAVLQPGQRVQVNVRVPLRGGQSSLGISRPGSYPVVIDINGEPEPGGHARRVFETHFLLPVLSLPAGPADHPAAPTPATMLVPLVDYPRIAEARVGGPIVLSDDQLAASLAPGGRLDQLVQAVADGAPPASPLGNSLCFAIDPDLLDTVNAMQAGYQVRQPDGSLRNGTGADAARDWLDKLKTVVKNRCVIALPYADADAVALARAGLPDLISGSRDSYNTGLFQQMLDVTPRDDLFWPIDGTLDQATASDLATQGVRTLFVRPDALSAPNDSLGQVRLQGMDPASTPTAQPIDPLAASALDPIQDSTGKTTGLSPPNNGPLTVQNLLGALAYRSTAGFQPGATSLLAPPRRWNLDGDDLRAMLGGMQELANAGYLKPTSPPFPAGTTTGADATPQTTQAPQPSQPAQSAQQPQPTQPPLDTTPLPEAKLTYPASAEANEIPQPLLAELAGQNFKVGALYRSSVRDPATNVDPSAVSTPLRNALLRSTSSAWRGNPTASRQWLTSAENALSDVLAGIDIKPWGGAITLTSSNAPIPLTVTNRLPVMVQVVLRIPQQLGIQTQGLGDANKPLVIPPGLRTFYPQTTARRAGQFTVDVTIATADGNVQLGQTERLRLEYFAYGNLTLPLTAVAAALLVVLSTRRIVRRIRASRARRGAAAETDNEITQPTASIPTVEIGAADGKRDPALHDPGDRQEPGQRRH